MESGESVDNGKERRINKYSSNQKILLVGEGDFSFANCLAKAFGSAVNITATSLDSRDYVIKKYQKGKSNLETLEKLGASLLHGVDATKMKRNLDLNMREFDRIIYNFPHAGFYGNEGQINVIKMHRSLVSGFFKNASGMLRPYGQIHVNHKITAPFNHWNLEELAMQNSLRLVECVEFRKEDYPGYNNKRGSGRRCDWAFPLGECSTFIFSFSPTAEVRRVMKNLDSPFARPQKLAEAHLFMRHRPNTHLPLVPLTCMNYISPLNLRGSSWNMNEVRRPNYLEFERSPSTFSTGMSGIPGFNLSCRRSHEVLEAPPSPPMNGFLGSSWNAPESPSAVCVSLECFRIFRRYFEQQSHSSLNEALTFSYEKYMAEGAGRTVTDYISILKELDKFLTERQEWAKRPRVLREYKRMIKKRKSGSFR